MANGTYRFDQSDGTNASHPLRFYEDENKTTAYATGVAVDGSVVTIQTPNEAKTLYYQCSAHAGMGNSCDVSATPASTATGTAPGAPPNAAPNAASWR